MNTDTMKAEAAEILDQLNLGDVFTAGVTSRVNSFGGFDLNHSQGQPHCPEVRVAVIQDEVDVYTFHGWLTTSHVIFHNAPSFAITAYIRALITTLVADRNSE